MQVHLSQFAEDVIVLNFQKCLKMSDAYCTGSSLMPQKKNPDALELLRGKTGRIVGNVTGFLCTMKGLPRAYNKDLQEDKVVTHTMLYECIRVVIFLFSPLFMNNVLFCYEIQEPMFDTVSTLHDCLLITLGVISTMEPVEEKLRAQLVPEMLATDIAEYLVRKGVPFRETHHIAGEAVKMAEDRGVPLNTLTVDDLKVSLTFVPNQFSSALAVLIISTCFLHRPYILNLPMM